MQGSGPHTIDYGYAPEKPPKEVLVSRKCAEAVLRGAQVYVPGVMACSSHVEEGDLIAVSVAVEQPASDGGWGLGITRGTVLQVLQTNPYYFEQNGLYIGQGTKMLSRVGIFRASQGIVVYMNNRVFKLPSFRDVLEGEIFLQNLPSIVTAHALDPHKGERILDMCAAPGGKTTAITILMKDEGEVIAADRSHNKDLNGISRVVKSKCYYILLIFVYCISNDNVKLIFDVFPFLILSPIVRCTINPGENEALVRYALDTYKFLSLAPQHPRIGGPGLVGSCEFPVGYIEEWLKPGEEEFVQRFDPSSPLDTIGFFIVKFVVGSKDT
ncbi:hypothetical protein CRYUN_Cryun23aG0032200 [Craigia yunnanensis]